MRYTAEGIDLTDCLRGVSFKTVVDDDIMLDDKGFIQLDVSDSDLSDLYSGVTVSFREYTDTGDFASVIGLDPYGWTEFDNNYKKTDYNPDKWEFLGSVTLVNLLALASRAHGYIGVSGSPARVLDYRLRLTITVLR